MALDTFTGAADTPLATHDSDWNAGAGGAVSGAELDGSGNVRNANLFVGWQAYYTGATNDVTITLPVGFDTGAAEGALAAIHVTGAQEGYTACVVTSGTTITQVRLRRDGTAIKTWSSATADAPATVTSTAGIALKIRLRLSTNDVIVTLDNGTSTEDFTWDDTGNTLSGGNGGMGMGAHGDADVLIAQWEDSAGGSVSAPVLDSTAYSEDGRTVDIDIDTDVGSGNLYWVITTSATQPTGAQIEAGDDHTDTTAADSGTQVVSGTGTQTISAAGPVPVGSNHWAHIVHEDTEPQYSNVETIALGDGVAAASGDLSVIFETTVSAVVSQTQIALTAGPNADSQMVGNVCVISEDGVDANFCKFRVTAYDATGGSSEHLCTGAKDATGFTIATGQRVRVYPAYSSVEATLADDAITSDAIAETGITAIQSGLAVQAAVDTIDGAVDAILLDTGTTLDGKINVIDTIVDAIKAKTDDLTFTKANELDANVQSINGAGVTGDGNATPWDGA